MRDQFTVGDRTAIVTGGSRGIGRTIAERFVNEGADVAICSREQADVDRVADELAAGEGGDCLAVECDVTDRDAVEALVAATVEAFGGLDTLVNNAGASFMAGFEDLSPNGWERVVDINLGGTANCCRAAADALADGGGTVVNVSSEAGVQGAPYMSHYAAAKAGVNNLTRTLGYEWADQGVRVNAVAPGYVATAGLAEQMGIEAGDVDRDAVDRTIGTTEEMADVVQFLASDAASFLVGETIVMKGRPDIAKTPEVSA